MKKLDEKYIKQLRRGVALVERRKGVRKGKQFRKEKNASQKAA